MMRHLFTGSVFIALSIGSANAQCPAGQSEVHIEVVTDDYGYELYWELLPSGATCGNGTIFSGGNPAVGCDNAGAQQQSPGGYPGASTITEGPFCLDDDAEYSIYWADDWGDGGGSFNVLVNGVTAAQFTAAGVSQTFTFIVAPPPLYDLTITQSRVPLYTYPGRSIVITGDLRSQGSEVVNSFTLNYSINGNAPVTSQVTGVSLSAGDEYEYFHSLPWVPDSPGMLDVTVWASDINGEADLVPANDAANTTVNVLQPIPNIIDQILAGVPSIDIVAGPGQDILVPRDLDFHPDPSRNELWVVNKDVASSGGSTVRFFSPGEQGMTWLWQRDPNAWHFMNTTAGIAFGDNGNFATCPGIFDANQNGGTPFTGPSLWDADPEVYAQPLFGPLGSHIDMLHVNPESQGIAHDHWNRYWVVDGHNGDITMNDFRKDHGPGNSWHGDAIIRRYADITITRDPDNHIVSHTVLDKTTGWLYVVDNVGQRVFRLNVNSGTVSGPGNFGPWESYVEYSMVTGYDHEVIITEGLVQPAGIEIIGDRLLVSDHANGDIIVFDMGDGFAELGRINTGAAGIMGITVGPDGHIWYVNATTSELGRVGPQLNVGMHEGGMEPAFRLFPVPATELITLPISSGISPNVVMDLHDVTGRYIQSIRAAELHKGYDVSALPNGAYMLRAVDAGTVKTGRFIVQR